MAKANPILWSEQVIADGRAAAIVLNSGGANCFTGPEGFQVTHRTAEAAASAVGVSSGDVLVCSTGLIGEQLDALLPEWVTQGMNVTFYFGGTSLLIIVGVAMDTVQQVESQLIMRHYDGFMKKTRIRGRRG